MTHRNDAGHWVGGVPATNIWKTQLQAGMPDDQLRVDGNRSPRARHPNGNPETDQWPIGWIPAAKEWLPAKTPPNDLVLVNVTNDAIADRGSTSFNVYLGGKSGIGVCALRVSVCMFTYACACACLSLCVSTCLRVCVYVAFSPLIHLLLVFMRRSGIGGPCSHFTPSFSYWCSLHPSGGGGFQYVALMAHPLLNDDSS